VNRVRSHPAFLNARAALAALSGNCDQGDGKLRRVEKARVDDDIEELIARVSGKLGVTVEDFMRANAYALDLRRRFDAHRLAKNAKNRRKKWKRELVANEAHYIAMPAEEAAAALGVPRSTLRDHWHSLGRGPWPARQIQAAGRPWKQELVANEAHYIAMTTEEAAAALGVSRPTLKKHWHSLGRDPWPARQIQAAGRPWKQELAANEEHYIAMTAKEAAAALGVPRSTLREHWHSLGRGPWPARQIQAAGRPWKRELAANEEHYIAMTAEEAAAALGVPRSTLHDHWHNSLGRGRWPRGRWPRRQVH